MVKGFKYGCGGAVGVVVALTLLPLLVLGGCLVLGGASSAVVEATRTKEYKPLALVPRHEEVLLLDVHVYDLLADVGQAEPAGGHKVLSGFTKVKVLGNGKDGCRKVELPDGTRVWVDGQVQSWR